MRSRWWVGGAAERADGVGGVKQRLSDLMDQIRYAPADTVVLVGHSHALREVLRSQLSARFVECEPELCSALKSKKLSNCGVARLELDFDGADAPIVGCQLLAGASLVK